MTNRQTSGLKTLICFALFTVVIFTQSCKKSDLQQEAQPSSEELQQLKSFISGATGVPLDQINYNASKKNFVAAKDIVMSLADAQQRLKNTEIATPGTERTGQRVYNITVTPTNAANIVIYADNTVPSDWITALDAAISNWNSINSHVAMKRVTATTVTTTTGKGKKATTTTSTIIPAYNILVNTLYDASTSMVAQAYLPSTDGTAGNQVQINTYYNTLSSSYKTFALTHELGHTVGFTHTDGTFGSIVSGTPETDANSVMNSFVLPWNGFTAYDLTAIKTIYPK